MTTRDKMENIRNFKAKINELSVREFELASAVRNATSSNSLEERVRELNITRGKIKVFKERIERLEAKKIFNTYNPATISINNNYKQ